jgi:hypothetical protein
MMKKTKYYTSRNYSKNKKLSKGRHKNYRQTQKGGVNTKPPGGETHRKAPPPPPGESARKGLHRKEAPHQNNKPADHTYYHELFRDNPLEVPLYNAARKKIARLLPPEAHELAKHKKKVLVPKHISPEIGMIGIQPHSRTGSTRSTSSGNSGINISEGSVPSAVKFSTKPQSGNLSQVEQTSRTSPNVSVLAKAVTDITSMASQSRRPSVAVAARPSVAARPASPSQLPPASPSQRLLQPSVAALAAGLAVAARPAVAPRPQPLAARPAVAARPATYSQPVPEPSVAATSAEGQGQALPTSPSHNKSIKNRAEILEKMLGMSQAPVVASNVQAQQSLGEQSSVQAVASAVRESHTKALPAPSVASPAQPPLQPSVAAAAAALGLGQKSEIQRARAPPPPVPTPAAQKTEKDTLQKKNQSFIKTLRTLATFSNDSYTSAWARDSLKDLENTKNNNVSYPHVLDRVKSFLKSLKTNWPDIVQQARDQLKTYKANLAAIQTFLSDNIGANNLERLQSYLAHKKPSNHKQLASNLETIKERINREYLQKLSKSANKYNATQANLALNFYAQEGVSNNEKRRLLQKTANNIREKLAEAAKAASVARAAKATSVARAASVAEAARAARDAKELAAPKTKTKTDLEIQRKNANNSRKYLEQVKKTVLSIKNPDFENYRSFLQIATNATLFADQENVSQEDVDEVLILAADQIKASMDNKAKNRAKNRIKYPELQKLLNAYRSSQQSVA